MTVIKTSNNVRVVVDSELMKHHATGMPVSPQHRMSACQDHEGFPLLFTIGTDDVFYLIKHVPGSPTGWERIPLGDGFGADARAVAFAVSQDADGQLRIALGLHRGAEESAVSVVLVSPPLSNKMDDATWRTVGAQMVERPFPAGDRRIARVVLGTNDDDAGAPLAIAVFETTAGDVPRAEHYRLNMDVGDASWSFDPYPMPENATHIEDLAIGTVEGERGVYTLYQTLAGQALSFTGVPDRAYPDKRFHRAFALPHGVTAIAALPGEAGSDLYAAGTGLYMFAASKEAGEVVWGSASITSVHGLVALQDPKNVSLWLVAGDNLLYHVRRARAAGARWTYPTVIRRDVTQVTALRDAKRSTGQVFVVHGNSTLAYLYQDPKTTLWRETELSLPDTGRLLEFDCYATHLGFSDVCGKPLVNKAVSITASSWTFATINGKTHSLDPDTPVNVPTDVQGHITILNKVEGLATPVFHLKAGFLAEELDVDPAFNVTARLKDEVVNGTDLANKTLQSGQKLVDHDVDPTMLDSAHAALGELITAVSGLPADGSERSRVHARRAGTAPSLHRLNVAHLPAGHVWGMSFAGGTPRFLAQDEARRLLVESQAHLAARAAAGDKDESDIGDFFEWLWNGLSEVGHFVLERIEDTLEKGLRFVVKLAGEVFHFALKAVTEVLTIVNWVLKRVLDVNIDKLIDWVGFIFDWDDVKRMRDVVQNLTRQMMVFLEGGAEGAAMQIEARIEAIKQVVTRKLGPLAQGDQDAKTFADDKVAEEDQAQRYTPALASPGGSWSNYQLLHGGVLAAAVPALADPSDPLVDFVDKVVTPTINSLSESTRKVMDDIRGAYDDARLSFNQLLAMIGVDVIVGLLDALKVIATGLLRVFADLIRVTREAIDRPIELPFLGAFVKWLYKDIAGHELTLLDGFSLLIAVPTTLLYKLLSGRSPITDMPFDLATASALEIFGALHGGPTPTRAHRRLPAPEPASGDEAEEQELSSLELSYSHIGGAINYVAVFVQTALDLYTGLKKSLRSGEDSPLTSTEDEPKGVVERLKGLGLAGRCSLLAALVASAGSFPVGYDKEVGLQRAVWGILFGTNILKPWLGEKAQAGLIGFSGVVRLGMEVFIFVDEVEHGEGEQLGSDIFKFFTNLVWTAGEGVEIAGLLAEPIDAETLATKKALEVGAAAVNVIGGVLGVARLAMDLTNELAHQVR